MERLIAPRLRLLLIIVIFDFANGFLILPSNVKVRPAAHHRCNHFSSSNPGYDSSSASSPLQMASVSLTGDEATLALWVASFASSHIGMSAARSTIISTLGDIATSLELVGRKEWKLPEWWPGDTSGGDRIFPDADTAGRQIYRAGYTFVSFFTLGSAFAAYLTASSGTSADMSSDTAGFLHNACMATAALSFGSSIASLTNASPLGLMPSFEQTQSSSSGDKQTILLSPSPGELGGIRRDDSLKFTARGLTRITRHPLILPVVPWGFATSYLAGNRPCDYILFGGLALYAVAGCFAQDLRVVREEGSVGTVFKPTDSAEEGQRLNDFFQETSFLPFGAVLDGRQKLGDVVEELPWPGFIVGMGLGWLLEGKILQLLNELIA